MPDTPDTGAVYESLLLRLAGQAPGAPAAPRGAAAVVPWRRLSTGDIEVYWVQRSPTMAFMGGWHAFPGGNLAKSDPGLPVTGEPAGMTASAFTPPDPTSTPEQVGADLAPGIAACALRELFEETALPVIQGASPDDLATALAGRTAGAKLADTLEQLGKPLDASRLVFAGRWLTPPLGPLRFDTRFFLLHWPQEEACQPMVEPGELASGSWIAPEGAFTAWQRGEVLAAPPILYILRVLAEAGPEAGLARLRDTRDANLGPLRRIEFRPGVLLFPLASRTLPPATTTNTYLLGHGEAVLIDPGAGDASELDRLSAALAALPRRAVAIWLTHHHPDHVAGAAEMRRRLGVPVLAHPLTAERLAPAVPVDGTLEDGQRIVLAGDPPMAIRVVHTPGHARGHLCFFDEAGRSLVAGDMVAGVGTIVIDPPEGDMDDYLASLERLAALAPQTLFPGHGPALGDGAAKLRELIAHRAWREARILDAWQAGAHDPAAMVATVYDDTPPAAHRIAERQILAHLNRLRRANALG